MSQEHLSLTQRDSSFAMAHLTVREQALAVSPTVTCQHVLCRYRVEILNVKNKLWQSLMPQGTPIAVSSDLSHFYNTLNRQDQMGTLHFLKQKSVTTILLYHILQQVSLKAKSNPLIWHSGPLHEA